MIIFPEPVIFLFIFSFIIHKVLKMSQLIKHKKNKTKKTIMHLNEKLKIDF